MLSQPYKVTFLAPHFKNPKLSLPADIVK